MWDAAELFGKSLEALPRDLLFIIEADQADVTATRLLVRPDGVLEVSIGNADERLDD